MMPSSIKTALNLLLVIAFFSMQLSSAHLHLAKNHQHDGSQHAHAAKAHAHALSDHHPDAFDNTPLSASNTVIEIAQQAILQESHETDNNLLLTALPHKLFTPQRPAITEVLPDVNGQHGRWLNYSKIRSRAPPAFLI